MVRRLLVCATLLIASLPLVNPHAAAQMPRDLQGQVARIGGTVNADTNRATLQLYTPLVAQTPKSGFKTKRDLPYGGQRLQVLDVYAPDGQNGLPVVLFVHGGGFVSGDKAVNPQLFSNVPIYFARNGVVGASMNYRLAPDARWPAGGQDVGAAVAWLRQHAAEHGGDPARIFLFGYSAGATHVASYVFDRTLQPAGGVGVAGAILLSGIYEVHPRYVTKVGENVVQYFGSDASQYAARSPLTHVPESVVPVLVAGAALDPPYIGNAANDLTGALCKRDNGRCPRHLVLPHHNHVSTVAAFNTVDEQLGREILAFVRQGR
jgi:triacylglycerol lipase